MKRLLYFITSLFIIFSLTSCESLDFFESFFEDDSSDYVSSSSSYSSSSSTSKASVPTVKADTDEKRNGKTNFTNESFRSKYKSKYQFKGDGTPSNPIQITALWQLYYIRATIHSTQDYDSIYTAMGPRNAEECHYKLMNDLDFATANVRWCSPFDDYKNSYGDHFSGVFDGNGYTLKNFDGCSPLFNEITEEGIVKNLNIQGKIVFDSETYSKVSPFCRNLKGALINCTFNGNLSNAKYIYDIANSEENTGVAIGCISNNTGTSSGLARGTKLVGSVNGKSSTSAAQLNREIGVWNALYKKNAKYQANRKYSTSASSYTLIAGTALETLAAPQNITPRSGEVFFTDNFRYVHSMQIDYISPNVTSFFEAPQLPFVKGKKIGIADLADGSKISLVPLNQTERLGNGRTIYFYELRIYHRNEDGSYRVSDVDLKKCYVDSIVDYGTKKAIVLKYQAGSSMLTIYTNEFINSYAVHDYGAGKCYDISINNSYVNYNPSSSQITNMINTLKD